MQNVASWKIDTALQSTTHVGASVSKPLNLLQRGEVFSITVTHRARLT